ncbi:28S ribosomal protein S31, mitochondrial [Cheilinus undulatus]|uniref:28S ribosomal protein S31, mitochondrial n=1 Tax=Cheilinus undulatus TaxID=241271 RepID=UPI001BD6BE87|nr:28S ribosomal protein S31, mitochondrial [Cheilinus undulatus]
MNRFLLKTAKATLNYPVSVYESCLLISKCEKAAAPAFRVSNGGGFKALSTSSYRHCEKTSDVTSSHQEEKTNAAKEVEPTETPASFTQKAEDESTVIKSVEHNEEPVVLKTDDVGSKQQQTEVKAEEVRETLKQVEPTEVKSSKESLLDLLGAMKVEVTSKRKLKSLKTVKLSAEPTPKVMPAAMESTISMFQKAKGEAASQSETLHPELVSAASAVASTLPDSSKVESELLKQLRQNEAVTEAQKKGDVNNLGVIIADMKVGKRNSRHKAWPSHQIRFDDDGKGYKTEGGITAELDGVWKRKSVFSGKRLNFFSPATNEDAVETTVARPSLWDLDSANQLSQSTNQLPRNGLEEMIQWTKEGKMWQYPINNEAGLEEETVVSFHEHVFLERHLEEGFPRQGPVRHFMELVVAGLSRNPYLTVQQKEEHISWFRDYFHQKEEILKEADVYLHEASDS